MPTQQTSNQRRKIDYQKSLRDFAKSMVHLRRPERLLKMIARFIDRDLALSHTSLLVSDEKKNRFLFAASRGHRRLPAGLIKIDADDPLILWFKQKESLRGGKDYLERTALRKFIGRPSKRHSPKWHAAADLLKTLDRLDIELAVPGYYKRSLQALLLLGAKKDGQRFYSREISYFQILAQDCSMAIKSAEYHENLVHRNFLLAQQIDEVEKLRKKERDTFYEIMRSLAQEIHAKDPSTFGHISQVEQLGLMTAKELGLELSGRRKDILSASLILHDIGKVGIPDHILKKPASLDPDEWAVMKTHADKGAVILAHLSDFKEAADIIRAHHENFDGSGYPKGLAGDQIPIEARIVSVVDAFHAIVSNRCYRQGRTIEGAFEELRRCSGTQFDPRVVEAFIHGLKKEMKKIGVGFSLESYPSRLAEEED